MVRELFALPIPRLAASGSALALSSLLVSAPALSQVLVTGTPEPVTLDEPAEPATMSVPWGGAFTAGITLASSTGPAPISVSGRLGMQQLASGPDGQRLRCWLAAPTYSHPQHRLQRAMLAAPFEIDVDASGKVVDSRFLPAVDVHHRDLLLRLVHALQVPARTSLGEQGAAITQPFGRRTAEVTWSSSEDGSVLHRHLTSQTYRRGFRRVDYVPTDGSAEGTVVVDAAGAVLSVALHDRLTQWLGRQPVGEESVDLELVRVGPAPQVPSDFVQNVGSDIGAALSNAKLAEYAVPLDQREVLAPLSFDDVKATFLANVDDDTSLATMRLKFWTRLHPEDAEAVIDWVETFEVTPTGRTRAGFALAALASAGHVPAQRALAVALTDPHRGHQTRERASQATLSVAIPERFLIDAVLSYRQTVPTAPLAAAQHRRMLLNIVGALGGVEHGVPSNTSAVVDLLESELIAAQTARAAAEALVALGNTGAFDAIYPIAAPYFLFASVTERRRAFHVFQKAVGDEPFHLLAQHYEDEQDPTVRRSVTALVEVMPSSGARNAWAAAELMRSADTVIQMRMVNVLGYGLDRFPDNRSVLQQGLASLSDPDVRDTIYRFIGHDGSLVPRGPDRLARGMLPGAVHGGAR